MRNEIKLYIPPEIFVELVNRKARTGKSICSIIITATKQYLEENANGREKMLQN